MKEIKVWKWIIMFLAAILAIFFIADPTWSDLITEVENSEDWKAGWFKAKLFALIVPIAFGFIWAGLGWFFFSRSGETEHSRAKSWWMGCGVVSVLISLGIGLLKYNGIMTGQIWVPIFFIGQAVLVYWSVTLILILIRAVNPSYSLVPWFSK